MTLKEAIKIIKEEYEEQIGKKIGQGEDKEVFLLKSNPDLVLKKINIPENYIIKTKQDKQNYYKDVLSVEIKFAKKYPSLYAKIIKVDFDKGYMIQEKLDTKNFIKQLNLLTKEIKLFAKKNLNKEDFLDLSFDEIGPGYVDRLFIIKEILSYNKFKVFIKKNKFAFNFLSLMKKVDMDDDIAEEQFGLDKKGNIKLLDI